MSTKTNLSKGVTAVGRENQGRQVEWSRKEVYGVEQVEAVPVLSGRAPMAGTQVTPVFASRSVAIKEKVGPWYARTTVTTGHEHFGSIAMALCFGPLDVLHGIRNGDQSIWEGPLDSASVDSFGRTTLQTTLGRIDFYWGTEEQNANPFLTGDEDVQYEVGFKSITGMKDLVSLEHLAVAYRGICYWVGVDLLFGGSPTPPNLIFDLERIPRAIPGLGDYSIEGETLVPDIIYDLLTDQLWGMGLAADQIDTASFAAGAETTFAEGLTVSPVLDTGDKARGVIGSLLQYIGGYLYESRGKVHLVLDRATDLEAAPVLDSSVLAGEPRWTEEGHDETFGETRLAWRDRERDDERTTEIYTDLASVAVQSRIRRQTINLEWVRRRDVAKRVVARIGQRAAIAARSYTIDVTPAAVENWRPGKVAILHYPKSGISSRVVRVLSIRRGGPGRRSVSIEAVDDLASDTSTWSLPAVDPIEVPSGLTPPVLEPPLMRVGILPDELVPSGEDGFIACIQRRTQHVLAADLYFAGTDGGTWRLQRRVSRFPASVDILWWTPIRDGNWLIRMRVRGDSDRAIIEGLSESAGMLLVAGATEDGVEQPMLFWGRYQADGIFEPAGYDTFDIELEGAPPYASVSPLRIGTAEETERAPTVTGWFGLLADFAVHTSADLAFGSPGPNGLDDLDHVRYVRTPTFDRLKEESIDDASEATYAEPAGTYAPAWGDPALSGVEAFDVLAGDEFEASPAADYSVVLDIDNALGAIYEDEATSDQELRYATIDDSLGEFYASGNYS